MLATAVIVLILCLLLPPNIFWLMLFIGTVFASSWGPVGFMSIWSKSITADAAFWGIIVGFSGNVIPSGLEYLGLIQLPSYLNPAILGAGLSITTIIFLSKIGVVTEREFSYRAYLHRTPIQDHDQHKARTTIFTSGFLILYGFVMPFLLIKYYVVPYQRGVGQLSLDGSLDYWTGESILALLTAPVYIILGLIVAWVVWRRYYAGSR